MTSDVADDLLPVKVLLLYCVFVLIIPVIVLMVAATGWIHVLRGVQASPFFPL